MSSPSGLGRHISRQMLGQHVEAFAPAKLMAIPGCPPWRSWPDGTSSGSSRPLRRRSRSPSPARLARSVFPGMRQHKPRRRIDLRSRVSAVSIRLHDAMRRANAAGPQIDRRKGGIATRAPPMRDVFGWTQTANTSSRGALKMRLMDSSSRATDRITHFPCPPAMLQVIFHPVEAGLPKRPVNSAGVDCRQPLRLDPAGAPLRLPPLCTISLAFSSTFRCLHRVAAF